MDQDNEKFLSVRGTRLLVNNVSLEDVGYYQCAMTFAHRGRQYNITRNIKLRVKSEYLLSRYLCTLVQQQACKEKIRVPVEFFECLWYERKTDTATL